MADEKFLQIKTAVNTRMPIELRTQSVQQAPVTVPGSDGTILFPRRHPIKSTYNDTYRHYYIVPGSTLQPGYRGPGTGAGAGGASANLGGGGGSRCPGRQLAVVTSGTILLGHLPTEVGVLSACEAGCFQQ